MKLISRLSLMIESDTSVETLLLIPVTYPRVVLQHFPRITDAPQIASASTPPASNASKGFFLLYLENYMNHLARKLEIWEAIQKSPIISPRYFRAVQNGILWDVWGRRTTSFSVQQSRRVWPERVTLPAVFWNVHQLPWRLKDQPFLISSATILANFR